MLISNKVTHFKCNGTKCEVIMLAENNSNNAMINKTKITSKKAEENKAFLPNNSLSYLGLNFPTQL